MDIGEANIIKIEAPIKKNSASLAEQEAAMERCRIADAKLDKIILFIIAISIVLKFVAIMFK